MKRIVSHTERKKNTLNVVAAGLTKEEEAQVEELVRKIARKRRREERPRLLYDMIFND